MNMRLGMGTAAWLVSLLLMPLLAHASCDTVKADIDAKIKSNGVADYTLEVVPAGQAPSSGAVVGHCGGGQQIVYVRGAATASNPAPSGSSDAGAEPAPASSSGY